MKKKNINKLDKNIVMMKSINKRLMKAKLKHYKNIKKERKQEHDLDLKTKMTKYMENDSFYRLRCGTIDWLTNYLVGGQPLIWWLVFDIVGCWLLTLLAGQNVISNIRIWAFCSMKSVGNCLSFPTKKTRAHLDF